MLEREFLIDVSRLIWRVWTGRLPTGIDRVCLAYLDRFGSRAQAVIQKNGFVRVLTAKQSDRLFAMLGGDRGAFRFRFAAMAPGILFAGSGNGDCAGRTYLNIGHTGLDEPSLPRWIRRRRIKAVYLIHDLIPITHPEFCRAGEAEKHALRMAHVLDSASGIIANSQATLDEFETYAAAHGQRLPASISAWISGNPIPHDVTPSHLDRPYFVTVGTIEGRKNHILLLKIWEHLVARLGDKAPRLLIVGQRGWEADHAFGLLDRNAALRGHVRELDQCEDEELARLIAGARAVLMPSFAEGFGLPVVEALELGTPVIASDLPVFREIAGGIPTFLDPTDGAGWEREIMAFCGDSPERQRQLEAMKDYHAPGWDEHFGKVERWLKTL